MYNDIHICWEHLIKATGLFLILTKHIFHCNIYYMSVCISCLIIHKMLLETVYFSIAKDIWRLSMKINRGLIKNQLISLRYRAPNLISLNNLAKASGSKHSHSSDIVRNFFLGKGGKRKRIWAQGKISDPEIPNKNEMDEMQK